VALALPAAPRFPPRAPAARAPPRPPPTSRGGSATPTVGDEAHLGSEPAARTVATACNDRNGSGTPRPRARPAGSSRLAGGAAAVTDPEHFRGDHDPGSPGEGQSSPPGALRSPGLASLPSLGFAVAVAVAVLVAPVGCLGAWPGARRRRGLLNRRGRGRPNVRAVPAARGPGHDHHRGGRGTQAGLRRPGAHIPHHGNDTAVTPRRSRCCLLGFARRPGARGRAHVSAGGAPGPRAAVTAGRSHRGSDRAGRGRRRPRRRLRTVRGRRAC